MKSTLGIAVPTITFLFVLLAPASALAFTAQYTPGQTLDPACLPSDPTCTVSTTTVGTTFSSNTTGATFTGTSTTATSSFPNLYTTNLSATNIGAAGASVTGNTNTGTLTVGSLTGVLQAVAGVVQTALVNLGTQVTGILGTTNGGTGVTASPTYGQLLVGNSSGGYSLVATSSLGLTGTGGTVSSVSGSGGTTGLTLSGTITSAGTLTLGGTLGVANGGTGATSLTGLITTADLASPNISQFTDNAGYVTSSFATSSANYWSSLGLGFSTSSANAWGASQGFSTFAYPFPANATTTLLSFGSGIIAQASSSVVGNFSVSGNTNIGSSSAYQIGGLNIATAQNSLNNYYFADAGNTTDTGVQNVGAGLFALSHNTTGSYNSAFSNYALTSNTTGDNNAVVGAGALYSNTIGNNNSAFGAYGLFYASSTSDNTAVGYNALAGSNSGLQITGNQNVAVGGDSLQNFTTGSDNAVFGYNAAGTLTSGANNTIIGAKVNPGNVSDEVVIGEGNGTARLTIDANGSTTATNGFNIPNGCYAISGICVGGINGITSLTVPYSVNSSIFAFAGNNPSALAFDTSGNLYVANSGDNNIFKITPAGVVSTFATVGTYPTGLIFDTSGNLYTANYSSNNVSKITPAGVVSTFAAVGTNPYKLAFDTSGNLYAVNSGSNNVSKITPAGVVSTFATVGNSPGALVFDSSGNLYTANYGDNTVSKITPAAVVSTFATVGSSPRGIFLDAAGNLYTANYGDNTVSKITPAGVVSTFATVGSAPFGLAFDSSGNLYTSNVGDNNVSKITPAGVVSTFATVGTYPIGLVFDSSGNLYSVNFTGDTISKISVINGGTFIGVDTATPSSALTVFGNDTSNTTAALLIANSASTSEFQVFDSGNATLAGTLTQVSDERLKTNINSLDASSSLAAIDALNPVTFNWRTPSQSSSTQTGFIAQQVQQQFPTLVATTSPTPLTPDGTLGLNYIGLISPIVSAIQALSAEVTSLEATIVGFADSFTSKKITTNTLCFSDGTGQTCVSRSQIDAFLVGPTPTPSGPQVEISSSTPMVISGTGTPPSIIIEGENPAIITVGATYQDLGAIATDNVGHSLSYRTFVNGALAGNIVIETTKVATDTIDYVATDTWGQTSTSTREVLIEAAVAALVPSLQQLASTTPESATSTATSTQ